MTVVAVATGIILQTIPVGETPCAEAYDPAGSQVYVSNCVSGNLSVIGVESDQVVKTIEVGQNPCAEAYDARNQEVWVALCGGTSEPAANVTVINGSSGSVVARIATGPAGQALDSMAYDGANGCVYVSQHGPAGDDITVISGETLNVTGNITLPAPPFSSSETGYAIPLNLTYDSADRLLYVIVQLGPPTHVYEWWNLTWIYVSNNTVAGTIELGETSESDPTYGALAFDSRDDYVWVANETGGVLEAFRGSNGAYVGSAVARPGPNASVYDPDDDAIYAVNSTTGAVTALSCATWTIVWSQASPQPDGIAVDSANGNLFVADDLSDSVAIVSESSGGVVASYTVASVPVGSDPTAVVYDPVDGYVYVANSASGNVTVLDGTDGKLVGTVTVGGDPYALTVDSSTGTVFVTNTKNVTSISGTHFVRSILSGESPGGEAFDNANGQVYVVTIPTSGASWNLTVINGSTGQVVANWAYGEAYTEPVTVTYDAQLGYLFAEAPLGYELHAAVLALNATTGVVEATINLGVRIGEAPNVLAYDSQGTLYVAYPKTDNVTVIDAGTDQVLGAISVGPEPVAVAASAGGTLVYVLDGEDNSISIISSQPVPPAYPVTLRESGLPNVACPNDGECWSVSIAAGPVVTSDYLLPSGSVNPGWSTLNAFLPNGTYSFSASTSFFPFTAGVGTLSVNGAALTTTVVFRMYDYSVTFTETGLPAGVAWNVSAWGDFGPDVSCVHGSYAQGDCNVVSTTTTSTMTWSMPNGTFQVDFSSSNPMYPSSDPYLAVTVLGNAETINVNFQYVPISMTSNGGFAYTQFPGYFLEGVSAPSWFWFFIESPPGVSQAEPMTLTGSLGSAALTVYGCTYIPVIPSWGSKIYSGYRCLTEVDLEDAAPDSVFSVNASFSTLGEWEVGTYTLASLGVHMVPEPDWLQSLSSNGPPPAKQFYGTGTGCTGWACYVVSNESWTWNLGMDLSSLFSVDIPLPSYLGGGTYSLLPPFNLMFNFTSAGSAQLTGSFQATPPSIPLGPVNVSMTLTLKASGSFAVSGGQLVWETASVTIGILATGSITFPIYGYDFGPISVGIFATITVTVGFAVTFILAAATQPSQDILPGLAIQLTNILGKLTLGVGVSVTASIVIASLTGGGSLQFQIIIQAESPHVVALWVNGTYSLSVQVGICPLCHSWTIVSGSGTLYEWKDPPNSLASVVQTVLNVLSTSGTPSGVSNPSNWSIAPRYYLGPDYDRLVWTTGASQGVAVEDAYPQARPWVAGGPSGATVLYTTDNASNTASMTETQGSTLEGLAFNLSSHSVSRLAVPVPNYEVAQDPQLTELPNGTDLVVWNAVPLAEAEASFPAAWTSSALQLAYYDPSTSTWSPVANLTNTGFSQSYALDVSSAGVRILDLVGSNVLSALSGSQQDLMEFTPSGTVLEDVPVDNVTNLESFRADSGLAVVASLNGTFELLNVTTGAVVPVTWGVGGNVSEMSFVQGSPSLVQALFVDPASGTTTLAVYNVSGAAMVGAYALPLNVSTAAVTTYDGRMFVVVAEPTRIAVYALGGTQAEPIGSEAAAGVSALSVTMAGDALVVLGSESYGNSSDPFLNLTLAAFTLATDVTVSETGLPTGTEWFVNVTGGPSYHSTTATIEFPEWAGTYTYTVGSANPVYAAAPGSFEAGGTAVAVEVRFLPVQYGVTFTESGLPSGTRWWVNFTGGPSYSGITPSIHCQVANGTFAYSLASADKSYAGPSGSLVVEGAKVVQTAPFVPVTYALTFTESGLPAGTSWTVIVDGIARRTTSTSLVFPETNSTYSYTVNGVPGYLATEPCGSLTVLGAAVPMVVTFVVAPAPAGPEVLGLPPGQGYAAIGAMVVVAAAAAASWFALARRRRPPGTKPTSAPPPPGP